MRLLALMLAVLLAASQPAARADDDDDHDRARRALEAGQIAPLAEVLAAVERDFLGRVIEVELEREDGRWIYEIKVLTPQGSVLKLEYDAVTRVLIRASGSGVERARRRR